MKITKELLEHLKVKSITFKYNFKDILCFLDRIEENRWTFSLPYEMDFSDFSKIEFTINFFQNDFPNIFLAKLLESGEDWITVSPELNTPTVQLEAFYYDLLQISEKYETFGRRKEERIKIGKEKSKEFGLDSIKQSVFVNGISLIQPCVIIDASVHGICIITPETPGIKNAENFCIKISFVNPDKMIVLKAHKVYSRLNKTKNKNFLTLSCQLLEPIHYEWRERIISILFSEP